MGIFNLFKRKEEEKQSTAEELFEQGEAYQVQNPEKAFQYYKEAADMGYAKAMHKVGQCYLYKGKGAEFDLKKSAYWEQKAAENGEAKAMIMTAWHYMAGKVVTQSDETAKRWLRQVVETGDEKAVKVAERAMDDYETKKMAVTAFFETTIEMGGMVEFPHNRQENRDGAE